MKLFLGCFGHICGINPVLEAKLSFSGFVGCNGWWADVFTLYTYKYRLNRLRHPFCRFKGDGDSLEFKKFAERRGGGEADGKPRFRSLEETTLGRGVASQP